MKYNSIYDSIEVSSDLNTYNAGVRQLFSVRREKGREIDRALERERVKES